MALTTFQQLRDLTARINRYRHEYHDLKAPSVTDEEYDRVLGDLTALEKTIGTRMADSPTWKIGYPSVKDLIQVVHTIPFPSPRVTARIEDIASFAGEQKVLILLYLDGPTVKLTYEGGELIEMATRGDGSKGEDITHNARAISGIPAKITCQERLVVLGKLMPPASSVALIPIAPYRHREWRVISAPKNPRARQGSNAVISPKTASRM